MDQEKRPSILTWIIAFAIFATLGYFAAYASLVKKVTYHGFDWPLYPESQYDVLKVFFKPAFLIDRRVRREYWRNHMTEEEIDENRREMFSGFGELAP